MARNTTNEMSILKNLIEKLKATNDNIYLAKQGKINMDLNTAVQQMVRAEEKVNTQIAKMTKSNL